MIKYVSLGLLKNQRNIAIIKIKNIYEKFACLNKQQALLLDEISKKSDNKIIGFLQEL